MVFAGGVIGWHIGHTPNNNSDLREASTASTKIDYNRVMDIDRSRTLIALITGSIDGQTWRHLYDTDSNDLLEDGDLSCAFFVSSILLTAGLINSAHATVNGCRRDLQSSEWQLTESPRPGDVIVWPAGANGHQHIGFYLDASTAVSNSSTIRSPQRHSLDYEGKRPPIEYWTHQN